MWRISRFESNKIKRNNNNNERSGGSATKTRSADIKCVVLLILFVYSALLLLLLQLCSNCLLFVYTCIKRIQSTQWHRDRHLLQAQFKVSVTATIIIMKALSSTAIVGKITNCKQCRNCAALNFSCCMQQVSQVKLFDRQVRASILLDEW